MAAMELHASIQDLAKRWLQLDQDETTRKEIKYLLDSNNEAELEQRLRKRIAFGTAGLRSSMKAGFSHMNSVTVLQASQGLAHYVIEQQESSHPPGQRLRIVIGHDARHNSEKFARLAAAAFVAKGVRVLWFNRLVHTPMVPFAIKCYAAAAGVMITASHNPKIDNGYKVYWSNGCQIIPPHDRGIAAAIDNEHLILSWDDKLVETDPRVEHISTELIQAYNAAIQKLVAPLPEAEQAVAFTYTPMHGVGLPFMQDVARILQVEESMHTVAIQAQPDPEFPTVSFPNPEEKGALDLAYQEAENNGTSVVLANDPDADRLAVAEHIGSRGWHQFSGNQMGILLGSYVFETYKGNKSKLAMLASTVSSRMIASMAKREGFNFRETLTGFKWLGNVAQELVREGYDPAYAYEEAIGYMFPTVVWDKDGIAAAAVFLSAWRRWMIQGLTPWQKLQQLYERYGYFEDANTYLISPSPDTTAQVFDDVRTSSDGTRPSRVSEREILRWRDLTLGYDSAGQDGKPDLPVDPSAQMITCELDGVVFTARGSGTEPKIKLYIEARGISSADAKRCADGVLHDLLKEWFKPSYGLQLAGS